MSHMVEKETFIRANTALMLTVVWGGLAVCALGAAAYDVWRWIANC